jgi:tRNA threonylcarbamoyladenosine biosynthesis protein TsaB
MRILAIETVGTTGSLAALEDHAIVAERPLSDERRSAQSLVPGIADLLAEVGWRPRDVDLVAVASGPGSFTGLRIGVTTAKTFAYATACQVIGVHTLSAIAAHAPLSLERICVVLDAQRNELFVADFERSESEWSGEESTRLIADETWLATLAPGSIVSGPGLTKLRERLNADVTVLDAGLWSPRAATIGLLGYRAFARGRRDSAFDLVPKYYRRTAAEEQWEQRGVSGPT